MQEEHSPHKDFPPPDLLATLVALYFMHKKHRDAEREKRLQYWREQVRALSAAF